jgi:hypothetical protein
MAWVRFKTRFIFVPPEDRRCAVVYPAGHYGNVRKICAEMARQAGALADDDHRDDAGTADVSTAGD